MEEQVSQRDFAQEVKELYAQRPELRGEELPQEVVHACVGGEKLSRAYEAYAEKNAPSKPAAKVTGVTRGGSVDTRPEDAFLRGFQSAF